MFSRSTGLRLALAGAALALLTGLSRAADDDKALRQKVLDLNLVTGDSTISSQILTLVEDKANTPKLLAVAVKMAQEKDPPLNYTAAYILARSAELLKDKDSSIPLFRLCAAQARKLMSPAKLFAAYSGIIADYYLDGKYDDSAKACRDFLAIPEEKPASLDDTETPKYNDTLERAQDIIRRELIQILTKQGKLDEANKLVDERHKETKDDMEEMELRALIQRETGEFAAAAKNYEKMVRRVKDVIAEVEKNKEAPKEKKEAVLKKLQAEGRKYRYTLSGLYIDAKEITKATDELKALLKEEPDNPSYNNDLGYVWADNDMNLADAEKLIRKAIEDDKKKQAKDDPKLKPDEIKANASYLDSLGWVLYKEKKYKEALLPLMDAVKDEEGQHIEIYDHLAEVHMALGDKAAALDAWKKGLDKVGTSKREQEKKVEVEKKVKANK